MTSRSTRPVALVVNPTSGRGRSLRRLPAVETALKQAGVVFDTTFTRSALHAKALISSLATQREAVVVVGGDGLVHQALNAFFDVPSDRAAVLGVVPSGRGNDFARSLGILSEQQAVAAIAGGQSKPVDVGVCNGQAFGCIASLGIDSQVNARAEKIRVIRGSAVYSLATVVEALKWHASSFRVTVDGVVFEYVGYSAAVANAGYFGGGMNYAPQARLDDGELDVVMVSAVNKVKFLATASRVFSGKHVNSAAVNTVRGRRVVIESEPRFAMFADGEMFSDAHSKVLEVAPAAVRVFSSAVDSR